MVLYLIRTRNDFYKEQIKDSVFELPLAKQEAFLAGEDAADSMGCYLVSFLKKNTWRHFGAFGAGMQHQVNRRINPINA